MDIPRIRGLNWFSFMSSRPAAYVTFAKHQGNLKEMISGSLLRLWKSCDNVGVVVSIYKTNVD